MKPAIQQFMISPNQEKAIGYEFIYSTSVVSMLNK